LIPRPGTVHLSDPEAITEWQNRELRIQRNAITRMLPTSYRSVVLNASVFVVGLGFTVWGGVAG
jgi:hypothetical protein